MTEIYIYNFHEHNNTTEKSSFFVKKNWEHVSKHYVQIMTNKSNRIMKNSQICVSTYKIYNIYFIQCCLSISRTVNKIREPSTSQTLYLKPCYQNK